jgi:hypothetical protein
MRVLEIAVVLGVTAIVLRERGDCAMGDEPAALPQFRVPGRQGQALEPHARGLVVDALEGGAGDQETGLVHYANLVRAQPTPLFPPGC